MNGAPDRGLAPPLLLAVERTRGFGVVETLHSFPSEVSVALSLLALTAATAVLFLVNLRLFTRGYRLRA